MEQLVNKYADKTVEHGLADPGAPLVGGLDDEFVWNRQSKAIPIMEEVFAKLNINSLLFCRPKEPYASIIDYLAQSAEGAIFPNDTETRTFLHDLPVARSFDSQDIAEALQRRKCVIIRGKGIVTFGTVSPEQAFVVFSSVLFACFVKFHADCLAAKRAGTINAERLRVLQNAIPGYPALKAAPKTMMTGPFEDETQIHQAMDEAGKLTVQYKLVDSFFGNISYRSKDTLYISQTGSSMDELPGCIDACPLDGSSSTGLTASSELSAHLKVITQTGNRAILHGHPKFPVILSLDCAEKSCEFEGECHLRCPKDRRIENIPIISGEVGAGPHGLSRTLPPALETHPSAIVHGHGLFTTGRLDYCDAFSNMVAIERLCREEFLRRVGLS